MRYYSDENLTIRDMDPADVLPLCEEERAQGWINASPEKNESRLRDRDAGRCVALTALWQGRPVGYVSVYWNPASGPFAGMGIPEIVDFNVIARLRRRGIGARLMDAARLLLSEKINAELRKNLDAGQTFAAARAAAAETACPGMGALLREPNNILGVEYCKAILTQNAALTPLPLPRLGTGHGGTTGQHGAVAMASAGYLRTLPVCDWAPFVPASAQELYRQAEQDGLLRSSVKFDAALLALLRTQTAADFAGVRSVNEGLEHRLAAAVRIAADREELYSLLKTKRYPHARLRRLALDAALHIPPDLPPVPYIQVLGAKKQALPRLKQAALPAGTALADLQRTGQAAEKIGNLHSKMVDFSALCRDKTRPMGLAFTTKPVVL